MVITMAKLRIATPPRVAHAKPPGPITSQYIQLARSNLGLFLDLRPGLVLGVLLAVLVVQGRVNEPEEIASLHPSLGAGEVFPPKVRPVLSNSLHIRHQTTIAEKVNHFWLLRNNFLPFEKGTLLILFLDAAEKL